MNLRELMEEDAAIFFDVEDGFGESATYNGTPIVVICESSKVLQQGTPGFSDRRDGMSDNAVFGLKASGVVVPAKNDKIVHAGKTWTVLRLLSTEAGMHRVECIANYSPHAVR